MKQNIVVIGGGNGTALMLQALKPFLDKAHLTAVVSTADSGGSSGALRRFFGTLPPGDILRAILALSPYDYTLLKKLFYSNRITALNTFNAQLHASREPNLGNLFLVWAAQAEGDMVRAIRGLEEAVEAVGHVHPVTLQSATLCVELANGTMLKGEGTIDRPTYDRANRIVRAWLEGDPIANPDVTHALANADYIVFGAGSSLYTSTIPNLLVGGVQEAIDQSRAKLICIPGDAYSLNGETGPTTLSEYVAEMEQHLPRPVDAIVYHNEPLTAAQEQMYVQKEWGSFEKDVQNLSGRPLFGCDLEKTDGGLSPEKLNRALGEILFT